MDVLEEELLNFWKYLNDNNVRYIMVGGFAIRFVLQLEKIRKIREDGKL